MNVAGLTGECCPVYRFSLYCPGLSNHDTC